MNSFIYNFYPQTGIKFLTSFSFLNNFSSASLIFLGVSGNANFVLESGVIKNSNDEFVSSFNKIGNVSFSGNLSTNNFNYFIDNRLIYVENKNYGRCTGIELLTAESGIYNSLNISIYGEKPSYSIYNQQEVYSEESIPCFISGDSSNFEDFKIYSIDIGGTLDANLGNSSYVPRNFFEISGQNSWPSGLKIGPGEVYQFFINQIRLFDTDGGFTYIPIYIESEFGTIYKRLFVKVFSKQSIEELLLRIDGSKRSNIPYANINFSVKTSFQSPSQASKDYLIYISGLNGNNYNFNNHIDTFTGSWGILSQDIDFYPKIIKSGNIELFDNTNNLSKTILKSGVYYEFLTGVSGINTGISGITENILQINSGFHHGIIFNVPYIYNTTFNITGIDFGIYTFGNYTGIRNSAFNSGISRGNINISLYDIDNTYRLKSLIKSKNIIISGVNNTGNNTGNIYTLKEAYTLYTNQDYALIINGYSSGYMYNYNLFLPTGESSIENNYINYISSTSGFNSQIGLYPAITGNEKVPYLKIMGEHVTDDNILIGSGKLDVSNENINYINIYKIYEFNGSDSFTGSAFLYISGFSGFQKSGILTVYKNLYREIEFNAEILN